MEIDLRDVPYDDPVAMELVEELQQEFVERYGNRDDAPVDPAEFAGAGAFLVAVEDEVPVGCVGLRRHDEDAVELKRMYVRRSHRRRGLGRRLLAAAEERAASLGYARIVLETGTHQPEAVALYATSGYERLHAFGHHQDNPLQRAFVRRLGGTDVDN